jgi:hypothetical protein
VSTMKAISVTISESIRTLCADKIC